MKTSNDKGYISDFNKSTKKSTDTNQSGGPIDFSLAQKIEGNSGSTCDIYVTRYNGRKVFVKRLKVGLRQKVQYLNAFKKEFEVGVTLDHPSLPRYNEFHGDYLVLDYIDGNTLSELIYRKDLWLQKVSNVKKLLKELITAVQYLHDHNIVHCDIKPDNIILTAGNRNVKLIDLDKCHTDWLDTTTGASSVFGIDENKTGHPDIDFKEVGMMVEKLGRAIPNFESKKFNPFIKLCNEDNIHGDVLLDWLSQSEKISGKKKNNSNVVDYVSFFILLIVMFIVGIILRPYDKDNKEEKTEVIDSDYTMDSITQPELQEKFSNIEVPNQEKTFRNAHYKDEIEQLMSERVSPLLSLIKEGKVILANNESSDEDLKNLNHRLIELNSDITVKAYSYFEEKFPEVDPIEIQLTVINCKSFKKASKETEELIQKITDEIVVRNPEVYTNQSTR